MNNLFEASSSDFVSPTTSYSQKPKLYREDPEKNTEIEKLDITEIAKDVKNLKEGLFHLTNEVSALTELVKVNHEKNNVYLDKIYATLLEKTEYLQPTQTGEISDAECSGLDLQLFKFPLDTVEELEKFNQDILNNISFKASLKKFLTNIGGTSGVFDGQKTTYKLVDTVFNPNVLVNYTWTGISRNKDIKKIPFQKYNGIIDLFLEVVLMADNRFNKDKLVNVFRDGILKHAKKRSVRKKVLNMKETEEISENLEVE